MFRITEPCSKRWTLPPGHKRRAVMAGVLLTTISPLLAQDGRVRVDGAELKVEPIAGRLLVAVGDPAQGVVANADVAAACAGGASGKARTDAKGVASFTALPAGDCLVTVRSPGFREWRGSVALTAGSQGRLEARLEVSDPGTKLEVRPKPPVRRFMDWLSSCARR